MSRHDVDAELVIEIWDSIKEDVTEKNRLQVVREMLTVLEDHGAINYDTMMELKVHDKYLKEAVEIIYKDEDLEEDEEEYEDDI